MRLANWIRWLLFGGSIAATAETGYYGGASVPVTLTPPESDTGERLQYQENGLPIRVKFREGDISFGRSNRMDCSLEDPHVSVEHAVFTRRGDHYYVTDISSSGGTFVDGTKIPENTPHEIHPGNVISLATVPVTFLRLPVGCLSDKNLGGNTP